VPQTISQKLKSYSQHTSTSAYAIWVEK